MSGQAPVSCLLYTLNEEVNLPHCLRSLDWCDDIVVVDSFSTDRTESIARAAGAQVCAAHVHRIRRPTELDP